MTDAFFAQRTRSTRDMRASQESVHGSQVPGTNPGTRANSDIPNEIRSIGNPRQVKREEKKTGTRGLQANWPANIPTKRDRPSNIPEDENATKLHELSYRQV